MAIASINPATGETLKSFSALSTNQIEEKLQLAADTFRTYRRTPIDERARMMQRAAEILDTEKRDFGILMTTEMGKPLAAAISEAEKCAWVCRYYAENAERHLADQVVETNAQKSFVHFQPIGPVLAVMPWNFPFWQVFRFAAPALMAGNVGLLKHASNVPQCALAIEEIFTRAGFSAGAFQTLLIGSDAVEGILNDPRVVAATLTGSEPAGRSVASISGKQIKKTVLELGGSDPFIVMPSANLDEAVTTAVKARTLNNGQSCIAAKRFIVAAEVYEEFERKFVDQMRALRIGDPLEELTEIGPLATPQIVNDLEEQVKKAVAAGARVLIGGRKLDRPGNFFEPTVLVDIDFNAPVSCEEIFGPVAMLFRVNDIDEAIRIANATPFGLGSAAWTNDPSEQRKFIEELEAGSVFINGMVASDPRLPFGGMKNSGYGRELAEFGIREFVNIKTVWIAQSSGTTKKRMSYPFADIDLARRLERTEGRSNADFVEARARAFPDRDAHWIEVAGAYAMFDGAGSPLTQTFGLGVFEEVSAADMDQLEEFFSSRGADVFHEVCPLADQSVFKLFNERGYQPIEFSSVLYRPISADLRLQASRNEDLKVRLIEKNEVELWAQTAFEGWSEFAEVADFLRELGQVTAQSSALAFIAELDGKPIATGALTIANDVALLAGASTIPAARRQGAQLALLEERLRYAAAQGCTIAMMAAMPGSGSQRNAERHGFRIAYTRTKWQLSHKKAQDARTC